MAPGKLVRGALYVHRSAVRSLTPERQAKVEGAADIAGRPQWNVARLEPDVVALLEYEDFDDAAFPRLIASTRVDLASGECRRTDYSGSANPLILHRKEQLMPQSDPRVARWADTTNRLVEKGLFADSHAIGRLGAWNERLARAGLTVVGDDVVTA